MSVEPKTAPSKLEEEEEEVGAASGLTTAAASGSKTADLKKSTFQEKRSLLVSAKKEASLMKTAFSENKLVLTEIDDELVVDTATAMQYDSFDSEYIKIMLKNKLRSDGKTLVKLCLSTIFFGNNFEGRIKKCMDKESLSDLQALVTNIGVMRRRQDATTLTLGRIGQSHPILIRLLREKLQDQDLLPKVGFETSTPAVYCDLSLTPLSGTYDMKDFMSKFTQVLKRAEWKAKKDKPKDADKQIEELKEAVERMNEFRQLAVAGWQRDYHHSGINIDDVDSIEKELALLGYH